MGWAVFWGGRNREGNSRDRSWELARTKERYNPQLHSKNYEGKMKISSYLKAFRASPENGREEVLKENTDLLTQEQLRDWYWLRHNKCQKQCDLLSECWGKNNCPSRILYQHIAPQWGQSTAFSGKDWENVLPVKTKR